MPNWTAIARNSATKARDRLDLPPREKWPFLPGYAEFLEARWQTRLRRVPAITPEQFTAKVPVGEIEEMVPCSLCGEERFQVLFHPSRRKGKKRWQYWVVRCPSCGFFYRQPGIRPERLGDLYATNYSKFLASKYGDQRRTRRYNLVLDAFEPF